MHHSVILWNRPYKHLVKSEIVLISMFLQCFDMFIEQTRQIMYQKWNKALLADLIWTCGLHVLKENKNTYTPLPHDYNYLKMFYSVLVDLCNPNPCQNGGSCQNRGSGRYECICTRLYHGENCENGENIIINW